MYRIPLPFATTLLLPARCRCRRSKQDTDARDVKAITKWDYMRIGTYKWPCGPLSQEEEMIGGPPGAAQRVYTITHFLPLRCVVVVDR